MENDLIERQSARDVIYNNLVANKTEYTLDFKRGMAYASSLLILEPPAVDALEVVHAHWEDGNKSIRNPTGYTFNWWCSHCGKPQHTPVAKNLEEFTKDNPYCHKCGARMDGEEEHNAAD